MDRSHAEDALAAFFEAETWMMTLMASMTNTPPTRASTISCLQPMASAAMQPPSASEPVSPMNILAGCALNQRKPRLAPASAMAMMGNSLARLLMRDAEVVRVTSHCRRCSQTRHTRAPW
jgi:hypothetical protein